ncbi:gas vesicle protein GvpG [Streptomyces avicenniae]|uniref:gas vesicle protein GvpG n=1 Tax=Streptomyces avicenniae TaxID=500153 RepID=UPI00069B59C0|nr:gas vesicle protein GvpG [Streptomyces avicenniae]
MGLLSGLLLLPLAPVRGTAWVAERIAEAADKETSDPAPVLARITALHRALDEGEIGEAEFEREEEALLVELQRRRAASAPPPTQPSRKALN